MLMLIDSNKKTLEFQQKLRQHLSEGCDTGGIMLFERDVERYLTTRIEKIGGLCFKFHPDTDIGMPDRVVILPAGKLIWVELKRKAGELSQMQQYQHSRLRKLGQRVVVVWGKSDVDRLIELIT